MVSSDNYYHALLLEVLGESKAALEPKTQTVQEAASSMILM